MRRALRRENGSTRLRRPLTSHNEPSKKHRSLPNIGNQRNMDQFLDTNRELSDLIPSKFAELLDAVSTMLKVNDQAKPLREATRIVLNLRRLASQQGDIHTEGEHTITVSDDGITTSSEVGESGVEFDSDGGDEDEEDEDGEFVKAMDWRYQSSWRDLRDPMRASEAQSVQRLRNSRAQLHDM
jgi:hypothetical protein